MFPTVDNVRNSLEGYMGKGYLLCCGAATALPFVLVFGVYSSWRFHSLCHTDSNEAAISNFLLPVRTKMATEMYNFFSSALYS